MITLLALSLLVILHELGHFVAAKIFGVKVEEFGFGIPPKALTIGRRGETEYTLNWLPLGGFVRLYGEQGELSAIEELNPLSRKKAFTHKPSWQRAIILFAGVAMNLSIGILLFSVIYTVLGVPKQVGQQILISEVVPETPAALAGLKMGQIVVKVGDTAIDSSDSFVKVIGENRGKIVNLYVREIQPDGTTSQSSTVIPIMPRQNPPVGQGALGVAVSDVPIMIYEKKPWYSAPYYGVVEGVKESYLWGKEIGKGIIALFANLLRGHVPVGLSGPVGVVKAGNEAAVSGIMVYLRFVAIISINLGIFNLFPLPALDGGRLFFLIIEKIVGKKRVGKVEPWVNGIGFFMLIGLLVFVTYLDLR
ncbi:MAG: site-2 protease family protein [bacterium]